jgi:sulfide:quinone oxidoreductase
MSDNHHEVLIVGGGAAGISIGSRLTERDDPLDVAILEPAEWHYYQPLWTLVGGGVFDREHTRKPMAEVMPPKATWIQAAAATFDPENNSVTTASGDTHTYDFLVVAAGIQLDWDRIEGLDGHMGENGICSNYSYETVSSTWDTLRNFKGGNAVFTYPQNPIKCAGAPQKIMWLSEHFFEREGLRENTTVHYVASTGGIFGVQKYKEALEKLVEKRSIETHFERYLTEVRADEKVAVFESANGAEPMELEYDMLHVTPPQSAPDFIKQSPLSNDDGWVDVDMYTTQHVRYPNVFSAGDCSSLPTSKTGAAVRKEVPVLVDNLLAQREGRRLAAKYDGYASCPLVTGYGRLILAEFDYDGNPCETFPFNQAEERYSMYAMKAYALPEMYWHGMLKGRA